MGSRAVCVRRGVGEAGGGTGAEGGASHLQGGGCRERRVGVTGKCTDNGFSWGPSGNPDGVRRKACLRCTPEKGQSEFHVDSSQRDGRKIYCRDCVRVIARGERARHRDRDHAMARGWYQRNRKRKNAQCVAWLRAHPAVQRRRRDQRRAVVEHLPCAWDSARRSRAVERAGGRCVACLGARAISHRLCMDHWIPVFDPRCPGTVSGNMVPLCYSCNLSKRARDPAEWAVDVFGACAADVLARVNSFLASERMVG